MQLKKHNFKRIYKAENRYSYNLNQLRI